MLSKNKIFQCSVIQITFLLVISIGVVLLYSLPITALYLFTGVVGVVSAVVLGIPLLLAAGYLFTSLAVCSLIIPLLPTTLPTILIGLITIATTAVVMTVVDLLLNIIIKWGTDWETLLTSSLKISLEGILYLVLPAILTALGCGLPLVAVPLHFTGGILPSLLSYSAITIGCIAKVLQRLCYVPSELDRSSTDSDSIRLQLWVPVYLFFCTMALLLVTFIFGGVIPILWACFCVLVTPLVVLIISIPLLIPMAYTMTSIGICSLVLPLLPVISSPLSSFAILATALAITFVVTMILDLLIDYGVKLCTESNQSNMELAQRSVTNTCWTFLLITLPTAFICWTCGLPTVVISSSLLSSALTPSTISIACATSGFLSKNTFVMSTIDRSIKSDPHTSGKYDDTIDLGAA